METFSEKNRVTLADVSESSWVSRDDRTVEAPGVADPDVPDRHCAAPAAVGPPRSCRAATSALVIAGRGGAVAAGRRFGGGRSRSAGPAVVR
ncbi:hypothetical protein Ate02nite_49530 [Paractinoplanes tereljensis]|uniref:Uncharacterized protein n=1 Tax=Paractinoplanes tereljensis TaxID=571912 RepID=A0A919NPC8_9ACTN|nr:hypothetical protein Ate02nite_49530 [Actinoplanes tereljensis]